MSPPGHKEPNFGLTWKALPIHLLGITITNDDQLSYNENFKHKIESIETLTKIWSTRNLSLKGKLTIINTLLIPKIIYPSTILNTPKEAVTKIENILSKFLWNWKTPKIKKDVIIRSIKDGGIKAPCIECKIDAWKSLWAIRCLKNEDESPLWAHIVSAMLPNELTLGYLFKSRPSIIDLNEKCPNLNIFYKNIIVNWTKIKCKTLTTKEQIFNECLWLNNLITINGKTLYSQSSLRNNLLLIKNLYTIEGNFKTSEQINLEFNLNYTFLDLLRIRQSIPHHWKQILNNNIREDKTTDILYNKMKRYKTLKCKTIYWQLLPLKHAMNVTPNSHKYWCEKYKIEKFSQYLENAFTCIRITFMQALQYKIINKIFNCNYWLTKIKILTNANCRFCNKIETIEHYFYECNKTLDFWNIFKTWWNNFKLIIKTTITEKEVILGSLEDSKYTKIFNCILLIAKGTIYNNKSNNKQPDFYNFLVQLKFYLKIEEQIHTKNNTLTEFDIEWGDIAYSI